MRREPGERMTLIDMVVVVAVSGLLLVVLVPAVQSARAAARASELRE